MLWGELKVDFDDLKHIVHPNRRFDELYNVFYRQLLKGGAKDTMVSDAL